MKDERMKWAQRLKQFVDHLQREWRVGQSAQKQYRSIVKDWIEFSLARGHDPAVFDQALVDSLLDHRAHRNSKGALATGSRLSYESNPQTHHSAGHSRLRNLYILIVRIGTFCKSDSLHSGTSAWQMWR